MPELNDGFDDSDESDNEYSNSEKANEDFSLDNFTSNNTSQTARSIPNISQYTTNYANAPVNKKPEHKTKSKVDMVCLCSQNSYTSPISLWGLNISTIKLDIMINNILATNDCKLQIIQPSSSSSMTATSTVPSMPQFLNDDLELSESDSDS